MNAIAEAAGSRPPLRSRRRRSAVTAAVVLAAVALAACSDSSGPTPDPASTAAPSGPAGTVTGSVWVADEDGDSLTVLDAATDEVVTTVTGVDSPHNVQVGRDGATVYTVSGDDRVIAIDPATYAVSALASTGAAPAHVIDAPNGKVYVTDAGDGTVSMFATPGLRPEGRIELGGMPHGLRPAADGSVIVVADTATGLMHLIDPATDRVIGAVPIGTGPAQVAVTGDGRFAYAGITEPAAVVKVDLAARAVTGTISVPAAPVQLYLSPDEQTVVSADQGTRQQPGNTLSVIDTTEMTVRGSITTGTGPHGVVIDPSGTRAWVTNTYDDTVSVVDLSSLSVVATVPVGERPNGVSFSPRPAAVADSSTQLSLPPATISENRPDEGPGVEHSDEHGP
ncbi:hypothetical protein G6038_25385 [Rhodococcus sp. 14C212]|uniref:YVTN family beta-propeller repeat protein n=1 Tax=Rhodococcus sp. 14C212 TaxID=2711209 RepID=UPI0013EAEBA9|nr:hypothetical protein [Rhodococcus sp. 14C212]NGP08744.1 hypothetical protein [Rhodococcus sp. 14C212]